jgi:PAS domain S-box-containing protein
MSKPAPARDSQMPLEEEVSQGSSALLRQRIVELESSLERLNQRVSAYETLFSANPIPALIYRADNLNILDSNASASVLYGFDGIAFRKFNVLELFATRSNLQELAAELRQASASIGPVAHSRADKRHLMVKIVVFPFVFEGIEARIALVEDATRRLHAEEELRASEERFRELFENANDVIFIHDLKGRIIALNRAAESMTGYSRNEVLGKSFEDLVSPESRSKTQDSIRAHLGGSTTQHYELPLLTKSGFPRFLEVNTRVVYRRGHPVAIQGIGRDVTDRKEAERKLHESSQELVEKNSELSTALRLAQEATQLKEQFLANTSHELRTPMNGIMGMVELLKTSELTPEQDEFADSISQCADDLLTIINDLLDLSQIEAGRLALAHELFDPAESLRLIAKMIRLRAAAKGLTLSYEISPGVPAQILGDSVRFRQVLTNLIANAVKFTQTGGVEVVLRLNLETGRVRCGVKDSGIGVDESIRDRIFEAFFQADGTTRRRFGGTGLGLAISKQLVEIMGGQIGVLDNNPLPGSTFWFELPAAANEIGHGSQGLGAPAVTARHA